jgi:N-methylhydantoinase B
MVYGDIMANITCNEVGGRLLLEFMDEYRLDDLSKLSRTIIAQTERAMRERIAAIPDGVYRNAIQVEGIDEPITLACAVNIAGDRVHIDFEGTTPSIRRGINVPFCYTRAFSNYALKVLTIPELPNNEGAANPISISVPPGCILNALPPSSTGGRHVTGHFVAPLIFGALGRALPDELQADSGMLSQQSCHGKHRSGRGFSSLFFASGGFGALKGIDGRAATPGPSNMIGTPIEIWEHETSVSVLKKVLVPDSGGPGEFRGGNAQEIHLRNDSGHPLNAASFAGRTEYPPLGVQGGAPGRLRQTRINGKVVHPKGRYILDQGDVFETLEAGGGGFGDPRRRSPEKLLADVCNGDVTVEGALRDYGVEVDMKKGTARRIG